MLQFAIPEIQNIPEECHVCIILGFFQAAISMYFNTPELFKKYFFVK